MEEVISQRLASLRKHLGERLESKLTTADVGEKAGLKAHKVYNLENGLNGTTISLVCLLLYYRSEGYNIDWILTTDNSRIPMMLSNGVELLQISEQINDISQHLASGYAKLNTQLRELGYIPLSDETLKEGESAVPESTGFIL